MEELEIILETEFEEQLIALEVENNQEQEIGLEKENIVQGIEKETDPTVPECVKNITKDDIEKWNNGSANASDIGYEDNTGQGTLNVQEALDEAFAQIENVANSAIIDLGTIDLDEYDGSIDVFMGTLTETGTYKFVDSYDNFTWYFIVYNLGWNIGQTYFNTEENYNVKHNRVGFYNEEEDKYEWEDWYGNEKAINISYEDNTGQGYWNVQDIIDDICNRLDNGHMACDIPYEDNYGYGVWNVQEALDEAYSRLDNVSYTQYLGVIDEDAYNDGWDFADTLTEEGEYKFRDVDFEYYVKVYSLGAVIGQFLWYTEEGFDSQYHRAGYINSDGTVEWGEWENFITSGYVSSSYALKGHTHSKTADTKDIRTWLDSIKTMENAEYYVNQTTDSHKFIVKMYWDEATVNSTLTRFLYQEYFEVADPSKIYKRVGTRTGWASTLPFTWGKWYVFEGVEEN